MLSNPNSTVFAKLFFFKSGTGTGDRVVLFLDNIQDAVRDEGARRIISTYVKQPVI
jgi:hypothetical protein